MDDSHIDYEATTIRAKVREALTRAAENGYVFENWNLDWICVDLLDCEAELEGMEIDQIRDHVREWFLNQGCAI